jgi:hypothetical protein
MLRTVAAISGLLAGTAGIRADELLPPEKPVEQAIDLYIDAGLKSSEIKAAPQADDATILRRLTLDLNGRVPTTAELLGYLADQSPDKRVRLVDRLLASPAFVRHQAAEFETLLMAGTGGGGGKNRGGNTGAMRDYLRTAFAENRPWDAMFRDVMLPDDSDPKKKGAGEFLRTRVKDLDRLTADVSGIFFGVNISCAQCHDHPKVDDWKQDHYYGMKSFFSRSFEAGNYVGEREAGLVKFTPNKGTEKTARVMFLTGKTLDDVPGWGDPTKEQQQKDRERMEAGKKGARPAPPPVSLRAKLVDVALEPGQRDFFARAAVNRVWHRFTGCGFVMPLDQMHSENPPSHRDLLAWLARDLVDHQYDLRRLVRGIVLSQTYSRDSKWPGDKQPAPETFAVARARLLTPLQLATSLKLTTMDPESLAAGADFEKKLEGIEKSAAGLVSQLPVTATETQVGVTEALLFTNSDAIQKECLAEGGDRLVTRLLKVDNLEQRADLAVRAVLSRAPETGEAKLLADYMRRRGDRPAGAVQQVLWALLTSAEFRFNH